MSDLILLSIGEMIVQKNHSLHLRYYAGMKNTRNPHFLCHGSTEASWCVYVRAG